MHASELLQRCLGSVVGTMHALRRRTLLLAVDALIAGRRLVLIDLARSWPDAERIRAPLKRLDRLLGNGRLHAAREGLYTAMARWLLRGARPIIVVDWCRLKADGHWHLLRAAVPVGGRTVTLLDMVFPQRLQGTPQAERQFLKQLKRLIPADVRPILVTDAGYRAPWCRAVDAMGWYWLTRLRHRTRVKPIDAPQSADQWVPCKALYELAIAGKTRDLGLFDTVYSQPLAARLIVHAQPRRGRHQRRLNGARARSKQSLSCARRECEPWILLFSPELQISAVQAVQLYRRRMQIELAFRDLKSHRFGHAFEDSLTRKPERIEILLLLHTLTVFAAWLVGLVADRDGAADQLAPHRAKRRLYSVLRLGWETLCRAWLSVTINDCLQILRKPPDRVLANMALSA